MSANKVKDGRFHYSGNRVSSIQFWKRVNALNETCPHLYKLGCILQNLEELVQKELSRCEAEFSSISQKDKS
jgi:hypothetical protein